MQLAAPPSAMLLLLALVRPLGFPEMPRPISAHVHAHTHTHTEPTKGHRLLVLPCDRDKCSVCVS